MLLDDIQAEYDVNEVHSVVVKASPRTAFDCVKEITPWEISWVMRGLYWLRMLPERLVGRGSVSWNHDASLLDQMTAGGNFLVVAENAPEEIVLGLVIPGRIGRFWQAASELNTRFDNALDLLAFDRPGYVRVAMNLSVEAADRPGCVCIRTETRCKGLSPEALRNFLPYWRLIRPFSGLIRVVWLKGIRRKAEGRMLGEG